MSSLREELASRLLGGGARVCGTPLDRGASRFKSLVSTLRNADARAGCVVGLSGLMGADLLWAVAVVWSLDAVPKPWSLAGPVPRCHIVLDGSGARLVSRDLPLEDSRNGLLHVTSGSTAISKVARRSVDSLLLEATGYLNGLTLSPSDRIAIPVPVAHSFGSGVALGALLAGCDVYPEDKRLPSAIAADLDSGAINKVAATPSLSQLLSRTCRSGPCEAHAFLVGAGVLTGALADDLALRFGVRPLVGYGSTETGGTFVGYSGIGLPVPGIEVVSPAEGHEGPLVLRTPTPVLGYEDEPPRVSCTWHTGDLVERAANGTVRYLRREGDDTVRLNGSFIDVSSLRSAVQLMPGVAEHAVIVGPAPQAVGIEALYLILASDTRTPSTVADELPWQGPTLRVVICRYLPRTPMGKLDREAMLQLLRTR